MRVLDLSLAVLLAARVSHAQRFRSTSTFDPVVETNTVVSTTSVPIATPSGSGSPCAQVSQLQASFLADNPAASIGPRIPASLAYECADSAPLVPSDATALVDGILAMVQFQSTLDFLESPPANYPIAGVNLVSGLNDIKRRIDDGNYNSELEFETALTTLLASVHDGHLIFVPDGMTVFQYGQQFGPLVSVSEDGTADPQLYLYREMEAYLNGQGSRPLAIEQINGVDATQYILHQTLNSTFNGYQDPDAAYNAYLWGPNRGEGVGVYPGLFSGSLLSRPNATTSIRFADGSTAERENFAITEYDFDGITDGESFYTAFCDASRKSIGLLRRSEPEEISPQTYYERWKNGGFWQRTKAHGVVPRQSSGGLRLTAYPEPEFISTDGSLSGYFVTGAGFEDVAVLLLRSFSLDAQDSFQSTLTRFLDACRANDKRRLIIDMTGNPGGVVGLGYDTFKQLFPTLEPWAAGNFRAHDGFRLLGESVTNISTQVLRQSPNDYNAFERAFGTTPFAAESKLDLNNTNFQDFAAFYGPVPAPNDRGSYTNQFRLDLDNPEFSESISGIVISGYDSSRPLAPQPFEPENMVILTDGQCSSTCAMVSHLLKWQGKVKSVAMGGRPQQGPMQTVGGVKGSQVQTFLQLFAIAGSTYLVSDSATIRSWLGSALENVLELGEYLLLRTRSTGSVPGELAFNIQNNIAEGDRSLTPLQFAYEAADCRLYFQPQHIRDVSTRWSTVAAQAFGLNGTEVFSGCVADSTDQPSSLSGNPALYNNGDITNVTTGVDDYNIVGDTQPNSGSDGSNNGQSGGSNAASLVTVHSSTWIVGLVGLVVAFVWTI